MTTNDKSLEPIVQSTSPITKKIHLIKKSTVQILLVPTTPTTHDPILSNKIKGLLLGLCLGDAHGVPYEFSGHKLTYTGNLADHCLHRKDRFGHVTDLDHGQLSDDSEMSLIIANYLITHQKYSEDIVTEYLAWANYPTTWALGTNTRALFKGVTTIKGYQSRFTSKFPIADPNVANKQQSNGHLMRAALLALCKDTNVWELDCRLTNPSQVSIEANLIFLSMIRACLSTTTMTKNEIIATGVLHVTQPVLKEAIEMAVQKKTRDVIKYKGWVTHAMYCTIYSFLHFDNYADGIKWIVMLSGDTDTNAAIAGALMGAYYGFNDIESKEKTNLEMLVNCTTNKVGNKQRPDIYRLCSWQKVDHLVTQLTKFYQP